MVITRQLLLPSSLSKMVQNMDLTYLLIGKLQTPIPGRRAWPIEVETYTTIKIDEQVHRELIEVCIKRKIDSNLLIKHILYNEFKK